MSHDVSLTCCAEFSASHVYRVPEWSEEENRRVFGKAANPQGHGHNYRVEVTLQGKINPRTGMVINIQDLKQHVKEVLETVDHKNLNLEVPYFRWRLPTPEHLACYLFEALSARISSGAICRVRVHEDDSLSAECAKAPDGNPLVILFRRYRFSSAHRLHAPELSESENLKVYGKCANPHGHGHNYTLNIAVAGKPDERTGCVVDLPKLDAVVKEEILTPWDHHHLDADVADFQGKTSTGENMAVAAWEKLEKRLPQGTLAEVKIGETPNSFFEYHGSNEAENALP